jgi:hypothetical protein
MFVCRECDIWIDSKPLEDLLKRFKLYAQDGGCGSYYLEQPCECFACGKLNTIHFKDFSHGNACCSECHIDISMSRVFDILALKYRTVLIQSVYRRSTT